MTATLSDRDISELSSACALDLSHFRRSHVEARVARVIEQEHLRDVDELAARVADDDRLRRAFRRAVAISVTGLFRDAEQFQVLRDAIFGSRPASARPLRAWSAGCATGEEAWSIAATLCQARRGEGALVLGSDVLAENVQAARQLRPSPTDLGGARLAPGLRVRFECRDIVDHGSPGAGWDVVLCRNVAIYLEEDQRRRVHRMLAAALALHGLLLLGRSERLSDPDALGLHRLSPHLYRRVAA